MTAFGVLLDADHAVGGLRMYFGTLLTANMERVLEIFFTSAMVIGLLMHIVADLRSSHHSRLLLVDVAQLGSTACLLTVHDTESAAGIWIMGIATSVLFQARVSLDLAGALSVLLEGATVTTTSLFPLNYN